MSPTVLTQFGASALPDFCHPPGLGSGVMSATTLTRMPTPPAPGTVPPTPVRLPPWTWAALVGYLAVVVALTCLKSFYTIGTLWKPENQRVRELRLQPFGIIADASNPFNAAFDILGNVAFFLPLGMLLAVIFRKVWPAVVVSAALSLAIEVAQYVFSLGRTDVTDLICNTVGALAGALITALFLQWSTTAAHRWARTVTVIVLVTVVVFAVLVILGPALSGEAQPLDEGAVL